MGNRWRLIVSFVGLLYLGCGGGGLPEPLVQSSETFSLQLWKVTDGPDQYKPASATGGYMTVNRMLVPANGERFLWFHLQLSNRTQAKRKFDWRQCNLDGRVVPVEPGLVAFDGILNGVFPFVENMTPGAIIKRKVAFSYPLDHRPTRLLCGTLRFPIDWDDLPESAKLERNWSR